MRPLTHADLTCAARALLDAPLGRRWALARQLVREADAADRYRQRFDRNHPEWGNGTLMSAALVRNVRDEPGLNCADYQHCLQLVLEAVKWRRSGRLSGGVGESRKSVLVSLME